MKSRILAGEFPRSPGLIWTPAYIEKHAYSVQQSYLLGNCHPEAWITHHVHDLNTLNVHETDFDLDEYSGYISHRQRQNYRMDRCLYDWNLNHT